MALEGFGCCVGKAGGKVIRCGLALTGVDAPAGGVVPFAVRCGGVDVYADENDVGLTAKKALGVDAADALLQGDIVVLWDEELYNTPRFPVRIKVDEI